MAESAVDLLTVDVAAVTAHITAATSEKAELEAMDETALFAEAAKIEAELQLAVAALEAKSSAKASVVEAPKPIGPCIAFEGTPIDCGLVAASAVQAADEDVVYFEAELSKATAALEIAKAKPKATVSISSPARSPSKIALEMLDAGLTVTAERTNLPRQTVAAAAATAAVAAVAGIVGIFAKGRRK